MTGVDSDIRLRGTCHVLLAFEVGLAVDLARAAAALRNSGRARMPSARNPGGCDWSDPPLALEQDGPSLRVSGHEVAHAVQVRIHDFGAISLGYRIPFEGRMDDLAALSAALVAHAGLLQDGRDRVATLLASMGGTVRRPQVRPYVEDYVVLAMEGPPGVPARELLDRLGEGDVARVLRAEPSALSDEEVRDSLSATISYGPGDVAVIDWNAALLLDAEPQATIDVLAFANVELLEYRVLDEQLDAAMDQAHATLVRRRSYAARLHAGRRDMERLAELQTDAALLYEEINNALKLLGDQFLARLYRLASRRLHLDAWERSTLRKLETLESIYDKLSNEQNSRRAELLEWIIIVLIASEIVFAFLGVLKP
ncbi:MAG: hypothetical protein ACO32J_08100 [Phycisphaerales bacterium]